MIITEAGTYAIVSAFSSSEALHKSEFWGKDILRIINSEMPNYRNLKIEYLRKMGHGR